MANRILVVDDNSDIRENICEYLNLRGHQTIGASDAASAAQLIAEEDIALIVLDVGLPGEDGMSFCRRLRLAGSSILILMLTARDAVDDRVAGLESGADDYVIKPFSLLELNARVEACPFRCVRSSWPHPLGGNGVLPFCVSASSSPSGAWADVRTFCPNAQIAEGFHTTESRAASSRDDLAAWLKRSGL